MQQNYVPMFEVEYLRLVLDAAHKRQGEKHQRSLQTLRTMARIINM